MSYNVVERHGFCSIYSQEAPIDTVKEGYDYHH